jgi:hypothetical protein
MIKKYNQFIKKTNEEFVFGKDQIEDDLDKSFSDNINSEPTVQMEEEEEGGDIYYTKLKELADTLGVEVVDNSVVYNGKKVIFPSETEKYHIEGIKGGFDSIEKVISELEKEKSDKSKRTEKNSEIPVESEDLENDDFQKLESKSYKLQRLKKFK